MSSVGELIERLIESGMTPADAATLFARATIEANTKPRSSGADRQARYRERNKPSQSVTSASPSEPVTVTSQASQTVTSDAAERPALILTSCSVTSESKTESKKTRAPKNQLVTMPDDFAPDRQVGLSLGWTEQRVSQEIQRFRDSAIAKGRKYAGLLGWAAAWRNWVNSPFQQTDAGRGGGPSRGGGGMAAVLAKLNEEPSDEPSFDNFDGPTIDVVPDRGEPGDGGPSGFAPGAARD